MNSISWLVSIGLLSLASEVFTFDSAPLGRIPPGWSSSQTSEGGRWEVRRDSSAPSPPYVLAQVPNTAAEQSPLVIVDKYTFRNGEISVRFKPMAGKHEQAAGLVWRYSGPNDYYLVRADAAGDRVAVYRVESGRATPVVPKGMSPTSTGVKHKVATNAWSTLKVQFRRDEFAVYYDHRRILRGQDSGLSGPGKVGLWTSADSVTYFDDFRVVERN